MFGKSGTFVDVHPGVRHMIAVDQAGAQARKYFSHSQTIELNQRHSVTLPQSRHRRGSGLAPFSMHLQLMRSISGAIGRSNWYCYSIG